MIYLSSIQNSNIQTKYEHMFTRNQNNTNVRLMIHKNNYFIALILKYFYNCFKDKKNNKMDGRFLVKSCKKLFFCCALNLFLRNFLSWFVYFIMENPIGLNILEKVIVPKK